MIDSFKGDYRFLSNFHPAQVEYECLVFPSTEHAYQAMKTLDQAVRRRFTTVISAGGAKEMGGTFLLRDDWEQVKDGIMLDLTRLKFTTHSDLRHKLVATMGRELIEGNHWHDQYWGVCNGQCKQGPHEPYGLNKLGQILMKVRDELFVPMDCTIPAV